MTWATLLMAGAFLFVTALYGIAAWRLDGERRRLHRLAEHYVTDIMSNGIGAWDEEK